jgi:hypothetical protein
MTESAVTVLKGHQGGDNKLGRRAFKTELEAGSFQRPS